jgi:hypothetical protein
VAHITCGELTLQQQYIVIVPRENGNAVPGLPIPNANCLVVRTTQDPRQIIRMKLDRTHIIQMSRQGEQNMFKVPHADFIVVPATGKHTPRGVKVDCPDGSIVFLKPIQEGPDPVIP